MIRQFCLMTCVLAPAAVISHEAFGQYNNYGQATLPLPVQSNPYNPFNTMPGYPGQHDGGLGVALQSQLST